MDVFPKFIIEKHEDEGNCLVIAKCTYHNQLAINKDKVKGGGLWTLSEKVFNLYGTSDEFGSATKEDIINCINNKKVFSDKYLINNISDKYKFQYGDYSSVG